jgi:hypothetical protein
MKEKKDGTNQERKRKIKNVRRAMPIAVFFT